MPWRLRAITVWLAGAAFIATGFVVLTLPASSRVNAQGPTVAFDPDGASVLVDDAIDVGITISEVTNLYSASVHVTFDPNLLEVVDADPARDGIQIFPGTFPGPSQGPGDITTNAADNLGGTIDYDFTLLDPAPPAEGSGTLAIVRFIGKGSGVSSLTIAAAALWDPYNGPIDADTVDGTLTVDNGPTDTPTETSATATPSTTTPTRTATARATGTPRPTSTPRPTATEEETATAQPPQAPVETPTPRPLAAAAPVSAANATPQDLPSAGDPALPTQLWRWFFLFGAVILGLATWAFSFRFYARQKEHERFWHGS